MCYILLQNVLRKIALETNTGNSPPSDRKHLTRLNFLCVYKIFEAKERPKGQKIPDEFFLLLLVRVWCGVWLFSRKLTQLKENGPAVVS